LGAATRQAWADRLQRAWLSRGALACLLWPLSLPFGGVSSLRRALYRSGWLRSCRLPVPVVVVGNLVAGGAGKTPAVAAIVAALRRRGHTPGIVSRGHGRVSAGLVEVRADTPVRDCGDEPFLLHRRTGVPVVVGRNRVAAGLELLRLHPEVDVIVSDDGLQHLRLQRDVQVMVFDERGVGNGWLLPAGPLRESLPATLPARTLVLYNAATPTTPLPGTLARRSLAGAVSLADWWQGQPASRQQLRALQGRPLLAAAGLARPQRFFDLLRDNGLTIAALPLPDHYGYATLPWPAQAADVLVTEKDAVKLSPDRLGHTRVWVAALDFDPGAAFEAELAAMLPPAPSASTRKNHGSPSA
jgi:tetraacyldisaccharide 4'-kinase